MLYEPPAEELPKGAGAGDLWIFDGLPPRSARSLDAWLDGLYDLALDDWLRVATYYRLGHLDGAECRVAWRAAAAVIADRRLAITAWFISDAVESATNQAAARIRRRRRFSPREVALLRRATEGSAFAIALEAWLDSHAVEILSEPFQALHLVPARLTVLSATPRLPAPQPTGDQPLRRAPSPR